MGLFDKVLKDVTKGIQDAVSQKVEDEAKKAAEEVVDDVVDKAKEEVAGEVAEQVGDKVGEAATGAATELNDSVGELKDALGKLDSAMKEADESLKDVSEEDWNRAASFLEGMAKDSMKGMRVCLECDEAVKGDMKFCPKCGAKLPEKTVTELALCSKCGKQNVPGTDFCGECGAKLPYKEMMEERQIRKDQEVLSKWSENLSCYPAWSCGGNEYVIERLEDNIFQFSAWFEKDPDGAKKAVDQYAQILRDNGFRKAGQYPSDHHLYKMVDRVCYHVDLEHCFESGADTANIYFLPNDEPTGGFDYVKPEPKKKSGGLFGIFK